MHLKQLLLFAILFACINYELKAQTDPVFSDSILSTDKQIKVKTQQRNFVKINLTAIALKNYSLQYERVVNRKISIAISFRTMPSTTLPFKNNILKLVGDTDPNTKKAIETFELSNFAFTPEVRFYLSKRGYGRGFYIAPFYRYASFNTNQLIFTYENSSNVESDISLSGKLTASTGGLMFGAQWPLAKHVSLDWWIFGPHYGSGSGNFTGVSDQPLTQVEQNDLRQQLENLDIPLTNKTVQVNANSASLKLDGPWGGLRAGLLLAIKF